MRSGRMACVHPGFIVSLQPELVIILVGILASHVGKMKQEILIVVGKRYMINIPVGRIRHPGFIFYNDTGEEDMITVAFGLHNRGIKTGYPIYAGKKQFSV